MRTLIDDEEELAVRAIPWWTGGLSIGVVLIVAVALVRPIGVSRQYVVLDGVLLHALLPGVANQSPLPGRDGGRLDAGDV